MTTASAETAFPGFSRRGWIQSPAWDLFWMFAALWGAALLALGALVSPLLVLIGGIFAVDRVLSVWHSWSTTFMVLGSPLLAAERRANRRKYLWWPAIIVTVGLTLGFVVAFTQRYPEDGRFDGSLWAWGLYLSLFWVGHFWHFGNQDFGVLTIYRARTGQLRPIDRRVDKLFTASMMFVIQPIVYVGLIASTAFAEMLRTALPGFASAGATAASAAVGAAAVLGLAALAFEISKPNRSIPRLLYIGVIVLHPVLLWGAMRTGNTTLGYAYVMAYLWSHWFIAVGLVGRINTRYYRSRGDAAGTALLRHLAVLGVIAGGAFLATQHYTDYALFNTSGFRYKELLAAITPAQAPVIGLVLGFFLSEQLLHYYCDRCLFRFRDPGVRRRVGPLLLDDGDPSPAASH